MFESISVGVRGKPQAAVVGQFEGQKLDDASSAVDPGGWAYWLSSQKESTGELGAVNTATPEEGPGRVIIVGLGPRKDFTPGKLRVAGGAVLKEADRLKVTSLDLQIDAAMNAMDDPPSKVECGRALAEGLGLQSWSYETLRGSATNAKETRALSIKSSDEAFARGLSEGLLLAESSNIARTLSQTPPNIATPAWMAGEAGKVAEACGLGFRVIQGDELEKEKMTGLINVGKASENGPCLIRMEYTPDGKPTSDKPIVLIGKTMTYDSGGLSIKTGGSMRGMKRDKDGGCGVIGAMHAIATVIKPSRRVIALLASAENSISDEAYRPDDVITFRNGVTVEVTNTDAEGRLVMADAFCWACELEDPGAIINMATLTGGVVVALGSVFAGMWCDDDELRAAVEGAGEATGERVWRLPHDPAYNEMMKSPIADIHNSAPVREAHPIQGAAFVGFFCDDGIPWAHLDIAGVHETDKAKPPFSPGPTGYGARLLAETIARYA
ncbi:MAG: leucyl aminopeptidase family protein [Planctomycetota bacterium]